MFTRLAIFALVLAFSADLSAIWPPIDSPGEINITNIEK